MNVFFLDSTVLVGAAHPDDVHNEDGVAVLHEVGSGGLGKALTSDLVIAECVTLLGKRRGGGARKAAEFARGLLRSPHLRPLTLDDQTIDDCLTEYARYGPALSFTDAASVVLMRREGCDTIFSHDSGFDRVPGVTRKERP